MSSWLAQSTEILLNQMPSAPSCPEPCANTSGIKYSITLAKDTTMLPPAQFLIPIRKIANTYHSSLMKINKQLFPATTREKILNFGSSINSQLPKKSNTSLPFPWHLFSQNNSSQESRLVLLQD